MGFGSARDEGLVKSPWDPRSAWEPAVSRLNDSKRFSARQPFVQFGANAVSPSGKMRTMPAPPAGGAPKMMGGTQDVLEAALMVPSSVRSQHSQRSQERQDIQRPAANAEPTAAEVAREENIGEDAGASENNMSRRGTPWPAEHDAKANGDGDPSPGGQSSTLLTSVRSQQSQRSGRGEGGGGTTMTRINSAPQQLPPNGAASDPASARQQEQQHEQLPAPPQSAPAGPRVQLSARSMNTLEKQFFAAACFYDAHTVQRMSKYRNNGGLRAPFASDEPERYDSPLEPRIGPPPRVSREEVMQFTQPLLPVGGLRQPPLPTRSMSPLDSYLFSRQVGNQTRILNMKGANGLNIITWNPPIGTGWKQPEQPHIQLQDLSSEGTGLAG